MSMDENTPMRFATNEFGTPLCPVIHTFWEWTDDDERICRSAPCGEEVDLIAEALIPLEVGVDYDMKEVGAAAIATQWKVECHRGHVIAMSDGEESAEDFSWNKVFGIS
jgi:hypothetical protein